MIQVRGLEAVFTRVTLYSSADLQIEGLSGVGLHVALVPKLRGVANGDLS